MLSIAEIKRFIDDDMASEKKRFAKVGQDYYEAKHDIMKCRLFYWRTMASFSGSRRAMASTVSKAKL